VSGYFRFSCPNKPEYTKGVVVLGLNEKGERRVLGASLDKAYSPRETYFSNG